MSKLQKRITEAFELGRQMAALGRKYYDDLPQELKYVFDQLPQLLTKLETDIELQNKREVYQSIARFLADRLNVPMAVCLTLAHRLCGETQTALVEGDVNASDALFESAKRLLASVRVIYERQDRENYTRKLEIYFLKSDKPALFRVEESLTWDELPADVRKARLRDGTSSETFKLFPREA